MTSKPIPQTSPTEPAGRFPEFPPRDDMQNPIHLHDPGYQAALRRHIGAPDTTIVLGEVPVGWNTSQRQGLRVPDLLVAFDVDRAAIIEMQEYAIEVQGKPPDFVLEVASPPPAGTTIPTNGRTTPPSAYPNTGGSTHSAAPSPRRGPGGGPADRRSVPVHQHRPGGRGALPGTQRGSEPGPLLGGRPVPLV